MIHTILNYSNFKKWTAGFHEVTSVEPEQIYHIDDSIVRPHGVHHIIDRSRLETEAPLASNVNNHRIRICLDNLLLSLEKKNPKQNKTL